MKEVDGLGLLETETTLTETKTTCRVQARIESPEWFDLLCGTSRCRWNNMKGYEIHMGETTGAVGLFKVVRIQNTDNRTQTTEHRAQTTEHRTQNTEHRQQNTDNRSQTMNDDNRDSVVPDGSVKGSVWGTYIHGIFDNDGLRTSLINALRIKKGMKPRESSITYSKVREAAIERWADLLKSRVDICFLLRELGMESYQKSYCEKIEL
jgi:adenosylcobyric acid synthase